MIKEQKITYFVKLTTYLVVVVNLGLFSLFAFHEFFNFTSSNTAIYVLRGKSGGVEISRDLLFEEADRVIFMLNANSVYHFLMKGMAIAKGKPVLELTWEGKQGRADLKQYRTDGTILAFSFSRYQEDDGDPHGLFLGGDLPYADVERSADKSSSGFGYFDGKNWNHIWCSSNEGFTLTGTKVSITPPLWKYMGGRVIKNTEDEVILESDHETIVENKKIKMKRLARFKAGDDYFVLKFRITNASYDIVSYGYAYGDEPWIGNYGASSGDVGWYEGGPIRYETVFPSQMYSYAGYWDYGNEAIDEKHTYTGVANFIEWISPQPTAVFFSNDLEKCCDEKHPLQSKTDRVINVVWLNQLLLPGESRDHVLAIGMAKPDPSTGFPTKPVTSIN